MSMILKIDKLNHLKTIFEKFDMDSDGSLSDLELGALLNSLGFHPSGDQIHVLFSSMDSNGNGAIEFDEIVHAIMPEIIAQILSNQGTLTRVFNSFDRDNNGYITLAELAGQMAKMGQPVTYRELMGMIEEADADGDGLISFDEFATVMAKSAADFLVFPVS